MGCSIYFIKLTLYSVSYLQSPILFCAMFLPMRSESNILKYKVADVMNWMRDGLRVLN